MESDAVIIDKNFPAIDCVIVPAEAISLFQKIKSA